VGGKATRIGANPLSENSSPGSSPVDSCCEAVATSTGARPGRTVTGTDGIVRSTYAARCGSNSDGIGGVAWACFGNGNEGVIEFGETLCLKKLRWFALGVAERICQSRTRGGGGATRRAKLFGANRNAEFNRNRQLAEYSWPV